MVGTPPATCPLLPVSGTLGLCPKPHAGRCPATPQGRAALDLLPATLTGAGMAPPLRGSALFPKNLFRVPMQAGISPPLRGSARSSLDVILAALPLNWPSLLALANGVHLVSLCVLRRCASFHRVVGRLRGPLSAFLVGAARDMVGLLGGPSAVSCPPARPRGFASPLWRLGLLPACLLCLGCSCCAPCLVRGAVGPRPRPRWGARGSLLSPSCCSRPSWVRWRGPICAPSWWSSCCASCLARRAGPSPALPRGSFLSLRVVAPRSARGARPCPWPPWGALFRGFRGYGSGGHGGSGWPYVRLGCGLDKPASRDRMSPRRGERWTRSPARPVSVPSYHVPRTPCQGALAAARLRCCLRR